MKMLTKFRFVYKHYPIYTPALRCTWDQTMDLTNAQKMFTITS